MHIYTAESVSKLEGLEETNQANQPNTCFQVLKRNLSKGKDRNSLQDKGAASLSLISLLNVKSKDVNGMQSNGVTAFSTDVSELVFN